jgi:hypothetical protein
MNHQPKRDARRFPVLPPAPSGAVDEQEELQSKEETSEEELIKAGDASQDTGIRQSIERWVAEKHASLEEITTKVYKKKLGGGSKICGQWTTTIPDEHSIGLLHGAGEYTMYVSFPATKEHASGFNRKDFELDAIYDVYKKNAQVEGNVPLIQRTNQAQQPIVITNGNEGSDQTLAIIQALIPLLRTPQETPSQVMQATMMMSQMINEVIKANAVSNMELFAEMQERMIDLRDQALAPPENAEGETKMIADQTADKPKTFLEQALPFIMPFIERISGVSPAEQTVLGDAMKAVPVVKEIMTNPKHKTDCKSLIAYLDKNLKTPQKTDEILKALGVDRGMYIQ